MVIKDVELNLNEIEFIIETLHYEVKDREQARYDDEVKMSNDDIRQIILKLGGLGNVVN